MTKFKQKNFFWGLVGNIANIGMVASIPMQMSDSKKQQEAAERQEEQNREIKRALDKIAKNASKAPAAAMETASVMQKAYAAAPNIFKSVGKTIVDPSAWKELGGIVSTHWKQPAQWAMWGGGAAAGAWGFDKLVQADAKRIGMELPPRPGEIKKQQSNYSDVEKNVAGAAANNANHLAAEKFSGSALKKLAKSELTGFSGVMQLGFGGIDYIPYISQRKQFLAQKAAQQNQGSVMQKSYSSIMQKNYAATPNPNGAWYKPWTWTWQGTKRNAKKAVMDFAGISNEGMKTWENQMTGAKNQNLKNIGEWMKRNPRLTKVAGLGIGFSLFGKAMELGEKPVRKAIKMVDKDAYRYAEANNGEAY